MPEQPSCIVLIGMAAAGKSTLGKNLAALLGWAFLDCDHVIEATYGARLQHITNALTKEEFLDLEATVIQSLRLSRAVIATGGSAIYRHAAMEHLQSLGRVVRLEVPLKIIEERIARKPDRGLAIAPGQTIEDLFNEREALYRKYAQYSIDTAEFSAAENAARLLNILGV